MLRLIQFLTMMFVAVTVACAASKPSTVVQTNNPSDSWLAAKPLESAEAPPVLMGELGLARIRVVYDALDAIIKTWNLPGPAQVCVLVFDKTQDWLVGCPGLGEEKGFVSTGESLGDQPVWWKSGALLWEDKDSLWEHLKMLVGTVGSYTHNDETHPMLIVQSWDSLRTNHPQFLESPVDEWLGVVVHEAFHASQLWHPQLKAMHERIDDQSASSQSLGDYYQKRNIGPAQLSGFYASNEVFRQQVNNEFDILRGASDNASLTPEQAKQALGKWLKLYQARAATMGEALQNEDAAAVDAYLTFVEGTARYVEAQTRRYPPSNADMFLGSDPTYQRFADSKGKKPSQVAGLGGIGPGYYYSIGMYVSFLLDVARPSWKSQVFDSDGLLVDQVQFLVGTSRAKSVPR